MSDAHIARFVDRRAERLVRDLAHKFKSLDRATRRATKQIDRFAARARWVRVPAKKLRVIR